MVASKIATLKRGGDRHSSNFKVSGETLKQTKVAEMMKVSKASVKWASCPNPRNSYGCLRALTYT